VYFLLKPHLAHPSIKSRIDISQPERTEMHYMAQKSHRMQKQKFGVMCLSTLFLEIAVGPSEHDKLCVDVSCLKPTRMHYVTQRSHLTQKHKFSVISPVTIFCGIHTGPTQARKIVRQRFTPRMHQNGLCDPHIALDAKAQVRRKVSRRAFCGNRTEPTGA
jgi:hypothetical protein